MANLNQAKVLIGSMCLLIDLKVYRYTMHYIKILFSRLGSHILTPFHRLTPLFPSILRTNGEEKNWEYNNHVMQVVEQGTITLFFHIQTLWT